MIKKVYSRMDERVAAARKLTNRPLTLAEKILYNHLAEMPKAAPQAGKTYVDLNPDRVAMQDATAQMALLQFMQAGRATSAVPATIHCDHLICAEKGAKADLEEANKTNAEVYSFLKSVG
ncbi:MAG: aconitate hydratase, partial [Fibrobacteres bacterium]|nr:aconitate hydratase [Fibrobacterota bacterium]